MATARKSTRAAGSTRASASAPETSARSSRGGSSSSAGMQGGAIMQWFQNPAVRYVATGIATAFLAKLATGMSERYPQISQLLRDGLDSVEGKLADFTGQGSDSDASETAAAPMTSSRSRRSANANLATH